MEPARISYPMRSRLPASIAGLVLFAGGSLFCFETRGTLFGSTVGLLAGVGSAALAMLALVAIVNLVRHEGWSVVLASDALELPTAPYRSSRRERVPYAAISFVGLSPDPPAESEVVVIHVGSGPQIRWVRQADLCTGTVTEIARLLIERVSTLHGGGSVVRAIYT